MTYNAPFLHRFTVVEGQSRRRSYIFGESAATEFIEEQRAIMHRLAGCACFECTVEFYDRRRKRWATLVHFDNRKEVTQNAESAACQDDFDLLTD